MFVGLMNFLKLELFLNFPKVFVIEVCTSIQLCQTSNQSCRGGIRQVGSNKHLHNNVILVTDRPFFYPTLRSFSSINFFFSIFQSNLEKYEYQVWIEPKISRACHLAVLKLNYIFTANTIFHQFSLKIVQVFEKMSENFGKTFFFFSF